MQHIKIFGSIDQYAAEGVLVQLATMARSQPLLVSINSDGGGVQAGVSIYTELLGWPGGLTTEIRGWALSIASLILMAGDKRVVHDTSLMMVHAPHVGTSGNAAELRQTADLLDTVAATMRAAYRRSGQKDSVIDAWLNGQQDHWFTAEQAVAAGLATELATVDESAPEFANAMASAIHIPHHIASRIANMTTPANTPTVPTRAAIEAAAVQAEAKRRADIRASGQPFAHYQGMPEFLAQLENDTTVTAEVAGQRILARLAQGVESVASRVHVYTGGDERLADFKAAFGDTLMVRAGIAVDKPHPAVRDLQSMSISALAESFLSMSGADLSDRSKPGLIRAAMSTSDFTSLLGNVAGKSLARGYELAPTTHAIWTASREVPDYKPQTLVNLSEAPALLAVREAGEYKSGSLSDSATTFQVSKYGRIVEITEEALVNDDTGAFTGLPFAMGQAARRNECDLTYATLIANPVLSDGEPLFHASHGNLAAIGTALSIQSLSLARAAMRRQKGLAGLAFLDPQPKFLIVPVALESQAEQLIASLSDPTVLGGATPIPEFVRGLTVVADPRLDENSTAAWYLAASPNQIESILRAYLQGQMEPTTEENREFRRDVVSLKVKHAVAVGVVDHRGLYRNPGA
jgi:ATP-dependent protease ClpP protease subunit